MNDPGLNDLLKWSIENSSASLEAQQQQQQEPAKPSRPLNADALNSLLGGPSDAEMMQHSMAVILSNPSPDDDTPASKILENKLTAFDNLEQLIENIDNANNLESLGMWSPLVGQLANEEGELRMMAAWCVGTAVQNNEKAQERVSFYSSFLLSLCFVLTVVTVPCSRRYPETSRDGDAGHARCGQEEVCLCAFFRREEFPACPRRSRQASPRGLCARIREESGRRGHGCH